MINFVVRRSCGDQILIPKFIKIAKLYKETGMKTHIHVDVQ
jgi:hypothetical protein